MLSGCWATRAALRRLTSSRRLIRSRERSLPKARGAENSAGESLLRILPGNRHLSLATARNFLGATARSRVPRHWNEAVHFLERWEQVSIRARRYKPRLNCAPANALRSCFSWAKGKTESKCASHWAVIARRTWTQCWPTLRAV